MKNFSFKIQEHSNLIIKREGIKLIPCQIDLDSALDVYKRFFLEQLKTKESDSLDSFLAFMKARLDLSVYNHHNFKQTVKEFFELPESEFFNGYYLQWKNAQNEQGV